MTTTLIMTLFIMNRHDFLFESIPEDMENYFDYVIFFPVLETVIKPFALVPELTVFTVSAALTAPLQPDAAHRWLRFGNKRLTNCIQLLVSLSELKAAVSRR